LVALFAHRTGPAGRRRPPPDPVSPASPDLLSEATAEILGLEQENKRLTGLAQAVAKDSHEDPLTGLSNRRHFEVQFQTWLADLR